MTIKCVATPKMVAQIVEGVYVQRAGGSKVSQHTHTHTPVFVCAKTASMERHLPGWGDEQQQNPMRWGLLKSGLQYNVCCQAS